MLKPNEIERFSMALDKPMRALENEIMLDIVRRIKINSEITRSADWQIYRLQQMGMAQDDITSAIQKHLKYSDEEMQELYTGIVNQGYAHDDMLYKAKGIERLSLEDNVELQQLISATAKQTGDELKNISQSLGFAIRQPNGKLKFTPLAEYYQQTLDSAVLGIANGTFDYNTVINNAINDMTNSGLRTVDYASGWSNRVDVATKRAIVTGITQLTGKVNEQNANELGTDMYEVSWHSGARPSHQVWQGKWFTYDELVSICGLGSVTGLCGANCRHSYSPVILGISEPTYTDEQLKQMNEEENTPNKYLGKEYTKYESLQRQRHLETVMRAQRQKIKLLEEAGADEDDIINARCRYRGTSQEYTHFSKTMNLPQQRQRVAVDGLGNIGVGKIKIDLTYKDYNDILHMKSKMSNQDVRKWYIAHNKQIPDLIDTSKTLEEQAKQACELRNNHKFQARELMTDQEKRKQLDISDPIVSFENLIKHKMEGKNMSREEAIKDILKTSTKTRKSVNKQLGLEE